MNQLKLNVERIKMDLKVQNHAIKRLKKTAHKAMKIQLKYALLVKYSNGVCPIPLTKVHEPPVREQFLLHAVMLIALIVRIVKRHWNQRQALSKGWPFLMVRCFAHVFGAWLDGNSLALPWGCFNYCAVVVWFLLVSVLVFAVLLYYM